MYRTSAPKRRTGCGTCKVRHKRCDEAKPVCENCRKTGRICDGYVDTATGQHYGGTSTSALSLVKPSSYPPFADPQEAQGFSYFMEKTGPQLGHSLANLGWITPLLQLSHQDSAIHHAAIAVGLMTARFEISELSATGDAQSNSLDHTALLQYSKSVAQLRGQLSATNLTDKSSLLQNVLACCILLIIFEFMQGNENGVLLHLGNAVKLLKSHSATPIGRDLQLLLKFVDIVVTMWLNLDRAHSDGLIFFRELQTGALPPRQHVDLTTLLYGLVDIDNDLLSLRHAVTCARENMEVDPENVVSSSSFSHFIQVKQSLQSRLGSWHQDFVNVNLNEDTADTKHRCSLLKANYLSTVLSLDAIHINQLIRMPAALTNDSTTDPELEKLAQFSEIVSLTETALLTNYPSSRYVDVPSEKQFKDIGLLPLFSFRPSFIRPLFFVAQHAPSKALRWRAIRVLLERPWREGGWDSAAMGSIARRSLIMASG